MVGIVRNCRTDCGSNGRILQHYCVQPGRGFRGKPEAGWNNGVIIEPNKTEKNGVMSKVRIFAGEDFAFRGQLEFCEDDTARSLDEFDVLMEFATTPLGRRIRCSTNSRAGLSVMRGEDNSFAVNVPGELSAGLAPGELSLSIVLTHKTSGVRTIEEFGTIAIVEPKIRCEYENNR